MKKYSDGLDVRQRILDIYAHTGFDGIDPGDLRGRFRWMGLYTQRAQGIPGGKTAVLEPEELEDSYFMMRVRTDGGQLTSEQLRVIGGISTEFGQDVADITDRQNVQLHWIRIEDVPEIWRRLDAVGLDTTEACGDCPRVFLGCPLAGVDDAEILDASGVIEQVKDRYIGDPAFSNLPRKYKTSISGCSVHCTNHEINDISFVGVRLPDGTVGYDLWVGGGLSTNPKLALRLGAFVEPDRVVEVWAGVTSLFRDYGYRRSRNRARLKFLMADWGPEKFRQVLEDEYLTAPLPDGPAPATPPTPDRDHVGIHQQSDGRFFVGAVPRVGRTSGRQLQRVAELAELYAELEKRLPDFDEPITINVNGCPNSCARFQTGDIGFKVSIVDGQEGFQVHLGGRLGEDAAFGRKSRGLKVTADGVADYVERVLRNYLEHRMDGERFATWARRADEALLQ